MNKRDLCQAYLKGSLSEKDTMNVMKMVQLDSLPYTHNWSAVPKHLEQYQYKLKQYSLS